MKKIRLDVDALRVESFETADGAAGTGTVHARQTIDLFDWCDSRDCGSGESCTRQFDACNCPVPEPGQTATCVSCPLETRPESGC